jgi:hypothetical protein
MQIINYCPALNIAIPNLKNNPPIMGVTENLIQKCGRYKQA